MISSYSDVSGGAVTDTPLENPAEPKPQDAAPWHAGIVAVAR